MKLKIEQPKANFNMIHNQRLQQLERLDESPRTPTASSIDEKINKSGRSRKEMLSNRSLAKSQS